MFWLVSSYSPTNSLKSPVDEPDTLFSYVVVSGVESCTFSELSTFSGVTLYATFLSSSVLISDNALPYLSCPFPSENPAKSPTNNAASTKIKHFDNETFADWLSPIEPSDSTKLNECLTLLLL